MMPWQILNSNRVNKVSIGGFIEKKNFASLFGSDAGNIGFRVDG
jgi:hypothetical protein